MDKQDADKTPEENSADKPEQTEEDAQKDEAPENGGEQAETEKVETEKVEPENVEPEKVEPEKVEPDKVEPEKVEPEKVEPENAKESAVSDDLQQLKVTDEAAGGAKSDEAADDTTVAPSAAVQRPNFAGKFKHIRSEKFEDYLRDVGVPWLMRKAAAKSTPSLEAKQDGDKFEFHLTTMVFTKASKFTIGQTYEEGYPSGAKYSVMPSWTEGNDLLLTMSPLDPKQKPQTQVRHVEGNTLTMTMTVGDLVCTRVFERIQ